MGEWVDRTFTPEGENMAFSEGENKRRASTKQNEDVSAMDAAAKAGVASALASGEVRAPATSEEQNAGIIGKLQSIYTSPAGVLGKAKTASRKLLS